MQYSTLEEGSAVKNPWFATAAGLAATTCLLHVVLGGREAARPLLAAAGLGEIAKFTNYYCWHLVTIAIAALAVAFAMAARPEGSGEMATFAAMISVLFAFWSLAMIGRYRLSVWRFPQWALFAPIASLGLAGLLT
jgi:nitrate reductase NapE component